MIIIIKSSYTAHVFFADKKLKELSHTIHGHCNTRRHMIHTSVICLMVSVDVKHHVYFSVISLKIESLGFLTLVLAV